MRPVVGKSELFPLLGELVFVWSEVEYHLMIALSGLLKTGFAEATGVFYSATSNATRFQMIEKLIPFVGLSADDTAELVELRKQLEELNRQRNSYVHGLYLIGGGDPVIYRTTFKKPLMVDGQATTGRAEPVFREELAQHLADVQKITASLIAFNSRVFHKIVDPTGFADPHR